jgi:hypothetical protein
MKRVKSKEHPEFKAGDLVIYLGELYLFRNTNMDKSRVCLSSLSDERHGVGWWADPQDIVPFNAATAKANGEFWYVFALYSAVKHATPDVWRGDMGELESVVKTAWLEYVIAPSETNAEKMQQLIDRLRKRLDTLETAKQAAMSLE